MDFRHHRGTSREDWRESRKEVRRSWLAKRAASNITVVYVAALLVAVLAFWFVANHPWKAAP